MFNWDLIFKHEQRMEELAIERLKLEVEKLRLEAEVAKSNEAKKPPAVPKKAIIFPKGILDLQAFPYAPYRNRKRNPWGYR